jgi:hypothetical protein
MVADRSSLTKDEIKYREVEQMIAGFSSLHSFGSMDGFDSLVVFFMRFLNENLQFLCNGEKGPSMDRSPVAASHFFRTGHRSNLNQDWLGIK